MSAQSAAPTVAAHPRTETGRKVKALRRSGLIPAVLYGNVKENHNLSLNAHDFEKIYQEAGHSTILNLVVEGEKPVKVLVHDVSLDPIYGSLTHVDFFAVNLKEKLQTEVPIVFTGVAPAVDIQGGIFVAAKDELEIECLPEDLPHEITVDISVLATFDDVIRVKDIPLPAGVVALNEAEESVASITEPISEEELAALDEAPASESETEFETKSGTDAEATEGEGADSGAKPDGE